MRAKLCGMKTLAAAQAAESAGADYIGFIFYPKSHRYIAPEQARAISAKLPRVKKVGVFVDESAERVNEIAEIAQLDYIQLHGHEDADFARQLNRPVIKAFRYGDGFSAARANDFPAELILVDAYRPDEAGGTGTTFDWRSAAAEIAKIDKPVLIAGGINAANVAEVNKIFHPYGVDVSGSLEINKEKSIAKINEFMQKVRSLS